MRRYSVMIHADAPRVRREWTGIRSLLAKEVRVRHIGKFTSLDVGVGLVWWSPNRDLGSRRIFRLWRQIVLGLIQQDLLDTDSHFYPLLSRYVHAPDCTPTAIVTIEEGAPCPYPISPSDRSTTSPASSSTPTPDGDSPATWQPPLVTLPGAR